MGTLQVVLMVAALLSLPDLPLAAAVPTRPGAGTSAKPKIVLMVADDLGYNELGCYGASPVKTPRIDALAKQGVRFTDAHSMCAICIPSRYSLLSGTYYFHAKFRGKYPLMFHEGQITLPSLLKSAGYRTAALGKWHNGSGREPEPDYNKELKPGAPPEQLYNLATDLRQTKNLAVEQPDRARAIRARFLELAGLIAGGRAEGRTPIKESNQGTQPGRSRHD